MPLVTYDPDHGATPTLQVAYIVDTTPNRDAPGALVAIVACPRCGAAHMHGLDATAAADPGDRVPHCRSNGGPPYTLAWPDAATLDALDAARRRCTAFNARGTRCRSSSVGHSGRCYQHADALLGASFDYPEGR